MALFHAHFFSETLGVQASAEVILPEGKQGIGVDASNEDALPHVLYLLHGYSDDHTIWQRRTAVERYASRFNLAIVMPAVNHSFYCNEVYGERYGDFIADELPALMHRFFRLSDNPDHTYVAGLSMGGYGAMRLALAHPDRYGAAASFSGAVDVVPMNARKAFDFARVFGNKSIRNTEYDLFHLMKQNAGAPHKPKLYVSCGTADFLYDQHQKFVPALKKHGWDVRAHEEEGAVHEWGFWDREIEKVIPWMMGEE